MFKAKTEMLAARVWS